MNCLLIGIGAAGNKACEEAVLQNIVKEEDCILINSTSKDFPPEYTGRKIILSPNDHGCGKERAVAKEYALKAIKEGMLNFSVNDYTTIIIVCSTSGGTGSGASVLVGRYFKMVANRNVHLICFTPFDDDDVRGLNNTIELFKEVDPSLIIQTIDNQTFLHQAGQNKFKAEEQANLELCKRIRILTGQDFIASSQNIDDTDILKVSNTSGYMTVEQRYIDKALVDQDDFNKLVKQMIYNSHSIQSNNPGAIRLGIVLNIAPESEDAIDFSFKQIKDAYGNPYECFMQKQWDGEREYIAIIASGMQMPLDKVQEIYDRYNEEMAKVNQNADAFYNAVGNMEVNSDRFNMVKPVSKGMSIDSFLKENS